MTRRKPLHPAELLLAESGRSQSWQRSACPALWRSRHGASKTELIRLRVEPEFKARVEAEAARRGMSVSAWITGLMKRSLRAS